RRRRVGAVRRRRSLGEHRRATRGGRRWCGDPGQDRRPGRCRGLPGGAGWRGGPAPGRRRSPASRRSARPQRDPPGRLQPDDLTTRRGETMSVQTHAPTTTYSTELHPEVTAFLSRDLGHVIDGRSVTDATGQIDVVDPGNGRLLCRVPRGDRETVDAAVSAAQKALDGPWSRFSTGQRSRLIWRLADLLEERAVVFAQPETLAVGKPLSAARAGDVAGAVESLRYMGGWATKLTGESIPVGPPGSVHAYTKHEPIGVVGQIVPWNFPLAMAVWKLAPALAAGCTCVL